MNVNNILIELILVQICYSMNDTTENLRLMLTLYIHLQIVRNV